MYSLAYDSDCGPCTRFRNAVAFLDAHRRMEYIGLDAADREGKLDPVDPERRRASFLLVTPDGRVWSGARALPRLAALLPGGALLSAALDCPPVFSAAAFAYSAFSRLHGAGACSYSPVGSGRPKPLMCGAVSPVLRP